MFVSCLSFSFSLNLPRSKKEKTTNARSLSTRRTSAGRLLCPIYLNLFIFAQFVVWNSKARILFVRYLNVNRFSLELRILFLFYHHTSRCRRYSLRHREPTTFVKLQATTFRVQSPSLHDLEVPLAKRHPSWEEQTCKTFFYRFFRICILKANRLKHVF